MQPCLFPTLIYFQFIPAIDTSKEAGIHGRRYFYRLISDMPMYRGLPSANTATLKRFKQMAEQVILPATLPCSSKIRTDEQTQIINCILEMSA